MITACLSPFVRKRHIAWSIIDRYRFHRAIYIRIWIFSGLNSEESDLIFVVIQWLANGYLETQNVMGQSGRILHHQDLSGATALEVRALKILDSGYHGSLAFKLLREV